IRVRIPNITDSLLQYRYIPREYFSDYRDAFRVSIDPNDGDEIQRFLDRIPSGGVKLENLINDPRLRKAETLIERAEQAFRLLLRDDKWIKPEDLMEERLLYSLNDRYQSAKNIIYRFIQTRGPFTVFDLQRRYSVSTADALRVLHDLKAAGTLIEGKFLSSAPRPQFIYQKHLQWLLKRSIESYRKQVEPVGPEILTEYLFQKTFLAPQTRMKLSEENLQKIIQILTFESNFPSVLEKGLISPRITNYDPSVLNTLFRSMKCSVGMLNPAFSSQHTGKVSIFLEADRELVEQPRRTLTNKIFAENSDFQSKIKLVQESLRKNGRLRLDQLVLETKLTSEDVWQVLTILFFFGMVTWGSWEGLRESKITYSVKLQNPVPPYRSVMGEGSARSLLLTKKTDFERGYFQIFPKTSEETSSRDSSKVANRITSLFHTFGVLTNTQIERYQESGWFTQEEFQTFVRKEEMLGRVLKGHFVKKTQGVQYVWADALNDLRSVQVSDSFTFVDLEDPANLYGKIWPIIDDYGEEKKVSLARRNVLAVRTGRVFAIITSPRTETDRSWNCEIIVIQKPTFLDIKQFFDEFLLSVACIAFFDVGLDLRVLRWNDLSILEAPIHEYLERHLGFVLVRDSLSLTNDQLRKFGPNDAKNIPDGLISRIEERSGD
ncbi:MAG TPA: hypothetical protein VJ044_03360, partial [Candidatus Hodarchaeales archaeon]|nr:hypothetical protein [Candidatus Hodarchaeales archaeon]